MLLIVALHRWLCAANERLRGVRTYVVAVACIILGALNAADLVPLFPDPYQKWATAFLPGVFIALRFVTTGPAAGRGPHPGDSQ